ncbi:MAG: hypothetical protein KAI84_08105, partial [Gammaproteobacteria bacterium]|nr:hypothetical protein [Gammaproteobacteria bacterium]
MCTLNNSTPNTRYVSLSKPQTSDQRTDGIREDAHYLAFLSILRDSTSSSATSKQFKTKQK